MYFWCPGALPEYATGGSVTAAVKVPATTGSDKPGARVLGNDHISVRQVRALLELFTRKGIG